MQHHNKKKKIDPRLKLCKLCIHGKIKRNKGIVCDLTDKKPDFYAYCPSFKVYAARDDRVNRGKLEENGLSLVLFFIFFIIYLFIIFSISGFNLIINLAIVSVIVLIISIYTYKKPNIVIKTGWFPYVYFSVMDYIVRNKEEFGDAELNIIKQQIIKVFGRKAIVLANKVFNEEKNNFLELKNHNINLSFDEKKMIFSMSCQVLVYRNLRNYKKSKILFEIAKILEIPLGCYKTIKSKYQKKEILYRQKQEEKAREEEQKGEKKQGKKVFSFGYAKYYSIMGLDSKASERKIKNTFKKLALKYHPDRFVGKPKDQKIASEKFKEISEAYNYIKRTRGL